MTNYIVVPIDYFNDVFLKSLYNIFPTLFNLVQTLSSPLITVMVLSLIVSFFARESLKFLSKL